MARLGLAVVSYHSTPDLKRFLDSLRRSVPELNMDVLVQVVAATEVEVKDTEDLLCRYVDETDLWGALSVSYNAFYDNVGYAKACNDAAAQFGSDLAIDTYAFFNADTEVRPGVLEGCRQRLWSDPSYGVVGPRQVDRSGLITHAGITGPPPRHRAFKVHGNADAWTDVLDDCWSVMGSAYFTKASLWWELSNCPQYRQVAPDALGAFLQTEHFFEDEYYSRHAVAHGYKVVYDGTVTMVHQQGGATPSHGWATAAMQKARPIYEAACRAHGFASA